jgi:hypothetical protein
MKFMNLWATPVALFYHPEYEALNAEILAHIELKGCTFINKIDLWDYVDEVPALRKLYDWMLECSAQYATQCFDLEYDPEFFRHAHGSINYRGRGQEAMMHTHRLTTVVMTYYVDVHDNCGDIRLLDPRSTLGWISRNDGRPYNQYTHSPRNGELILFPGWVTHMVAQNQSDKDRVAITSNVHLKEEFKDKVY